MKSNETGFPNPKPIEAALIGLWINRLKLTAIGPCTTFFEAGGNVAIAVQLIDDIRLIFGVSIDVGCLAPQTTPQSLAMDVIRARDKVSTSIPNFVPYPRDQQIPLTFSQERMWFIHQINQNSTAYNVGGAVELVGRLDREALQKSINLLVARNEILRTIFPAEDGRPIQKILAPYEFPIEWVDLGSLSPADQFEKTQELVNKWVQTPFDLVSAPLFLIKVIRINAEHFYLAINFHHIITDAWGMGVFAQKIGQFYNAIVRGEPIESENTTYQYADYAVWQRDYLNDMRMDNLLQYWSENLDGIVPIELPTSHSRPPVQTYNGSYAQADFSTQIVNRILEICRKENTTPFMFLLSAYYLLLYRYSSQKDLAVAVPIANRNWSVTESMIGSLVNTLLMRIKLEEDFSFLDLLRLVRQQAIQAYDHQDMPYAMLVASLQPGRDVSRSPFAQVMFNQVNVQYDLDFLTGIKAKIADTDRLGVQFDLVMNITEMSGGYRLRLEYNTDLFDPDEIERMVGHYLGLIESALDHPEQRIIRLQMVSPKELVELEQWNDTKVQFPGDRTVLQLFMEQVSRSPNDIALIDPNSQITVQELDRRSNQFAHHLKYLGLVPGTFVGVWLNRSIEMVTAILGIIKAGGAYMPLDTGYPLERLTFMLKDANTPIVIGRSREEQKSLDFDGVFINLENDLENIQAQSDAAVPAAGRPEDPLFILYTSGSTGQPKGVVGDHRAAINRIAWMWRVFPFSPGEVACQKNSFNFVDHVWELFGPLLKGIPLLILSDEDVKDPYQLVDALSKYRVTRIIVMPSYLNQLLSSQPNLDQKLPNLYLWTCSSEPLPLELVRRFYRHLPGKTMLNLYGSSEDAGDVAWYDTRELLESAVNVPIGRPIDNTQIYILDEHKNIQPVGLPGELYVGGAGLAIGYHNRPELNREKFIPNPFVAESTSRLFRTSDIGYYLANGNIVLLGRKDRQIKIRGFRIELDEVEGAILEMPGVQECAVVFIRDGEMLDRLIACIIPETGMILAESDLRKSLQAKLPEYMIPQQIIQFEQFPRTPNGKVDRGELAKAGSQQCHALRVIEEPEDLLEVRLTSIWKKVIKANSIGRDENFFDLGGHSLLAIELLTQIQAEMGVKIPVLTFFQSPTIAGIAHALRQGAKEIEWQTIVPIHTNGSRPPFFCIHGFQGGVTGYLDLAHCLGPEQPFFGIQANGLDGRSSPLDRIEEIATSYIDKIQGQIQPHGPYFLGGYCFGGLIVYEMARQFAARGETVGLVALLETYPFDRNENLLQFLKPGNFLRFSRNLPRWLSEEKERKGRDQKKLEQWQKVMNSCADYSWVEVPKNAIDDFFDPSALFYPGNRPVVMAHTHANQIYRPGAYSGDVDVFKVGVYRLTFPLDDDLGWGKLVNGKVQVHRIPGSHDNFLDLPFVEKLAEILGQCIETRIRS